MCGDSCRPAFGGTIAVLFPPAQSANSDAALSSSPQSMAVQSTIASMFSFYLYFFNGEGNTRAFFQMKDEATYRAMQSFERIDIRIEKSGDITQSLEAAPLKEYKLALDPSKAGAGDSKEIEFMLPFRLDLNVSEHGVIGRQVTVREVGGSVLAIGVIGYN